jgi:hypothetical protein
MHCHYSGAEQVMADPGCFKGISKISLITAISSEYRKRLTSLVNNCER